MSKSLRYTFLVHAVVALAFGLPLLIMPGRTLDLFGWAPIDPIMTRLFGAALLALSWGSYRGWRAAVRSDVAILLQVEAVFTVLSVIGIVRHLLVGSWPWYMWMTVIIFALFAVAWIYHLLRK
jgi:hypothetical protein